MKDLTNVRNKDLTNVRNLAIICLIICLVSVGFKQIEPAMYFFFKMVILTIFHIGLDSAKYFKRA